MTDLHDDQPLIFPPTISLGGRLEDAELGIGVQDADQSCSLNHGQVQQEPFVADHVMVVVATGGSVQAPTVDRRFNVTGTVER